MLTTPSRMETIHTYSTSNQQLTFEEYDGATTNTITVGITAATKYPHDALDELVGVMTTASSCGASYGWEYIYPDGLVVLTGGGGTLVSWRPKITASGPASKVLTGGDLPAGGCGKYHLGFCVLSSDPPLALAHTSPKPVWGSWAPVYPPNDIDQTLHVVNSRAIDNGGGITVYDFSPDAGRKTIQYGWTFISDHDYTQLQEFWTACRGGQKVAFFTDRLSPSFVEYILLPDDSLKWDRLAGYPLYEGTLNFGEAV